MSSQEKKRKQQCIKALLMRQKERRAGRRAVQATDSNDTNKATVPKKIVPKIDSKKIATERELQQITEARQKLYAAKHQYRIAVREHEVALKEIEMQLREFRQRVAELKRR